MGDYYVKLIPLDPNFVPEQEKLRKLEEELLPVLHTWAAEVKIHIKDTPIFVDQGQNFETVSCPYCKQELDVGWWGNAMDTVFKSNFLDLEIDVPCCRRKVSLNDLEYYFPAGFARFIIELLEPGFIEEEYVEWLEEQLGFKLKQVKVKY